MNLSQAIYTLLSTDATLIAMLSEFENLPAIFTTDPVPGNATLPYIVSAGDVTHNPFDTKTTLGRQVLRDIRCYTDASGSAVEVEAIAERVRELLHRKVFTISGYEVIVTNCIGPIAADDIDSYGRVVTIDLKVQKEI